MKLIVQIALGVFLGTVTAQLTLDVWREYQEEKQLTEREQVRLEQADKIRRLFLENQNRKKSQHINPPAGFIPDDAQSFPAQTE